MESSIDEQIEEKTVDAEIIDEELEPTHEEPEEMEEVEKEEEQLAEVNGEEVEPLKALEKVMESAMDAFERTFTVDSCTPADILAADELCDRLFSRFTRIQSGLKQKLREFVMRPTD